MEAVWPVLKLLLIFTAVAAGIVFWFVFMTRYRPIAFTIEEISAQLPTPKPIHVVAPMEEATFTQLPAAHHYQSQSPASDELKAA